MATYPTTDTIRQYAICVWWSYRQMLARDINCNRAAYEYPYAEED